MKKKEFRLEHLAFGMAALFAESNKVTAGIGLIIVLSNVASSIISEAREFSLLMNGVFGIVLLFLMFMWDTRAEEGIETLRKFMEDEYDKDREVS